MTIHLEESVLHDLYLLWDKIVREANITSTLRKPVLALHHDAAWGLWKGNTRTLSLNHELAMHGAAEEVEETLRHEIAHQWVQEVAQNGNERPHGPTWKKACEIFGAKPRATAETPLEKVVDRNHSQRKRIADKIKKLFALAESDNQHEAEQATLLANALMLKYRIREIEDDERQFSYVRIGLPYRRRPRWINSVVQILECHFGVNAIWIPEEDIPHTNRLEILGTEANLEIATYVHDFLIREGEILAERYRQETGQTSAKAKRDYLYGLYNGFYDKLDAQKKTHLDQIHTSKTRALIRRGDPLLLNYFKKRYPRVRIERVKPIRVHGSYRSGMAAGQELSIRGAVRENRSRDLQLKSGR